MQLTMELGEKANAVTTQVNTCNNEGILFVVQTSTCTRATRTD